MQQALTTVLETALRLAGVEAAVLEPGSAAQRALASRLRQQLAAALGVNVRARRPPCTPQRARVSEAPPPAVESSR